MRSEQRGQHKDAEREQLWLLEHQRRIPRATTALHEQVAAAIRRAIADGAAKPGDRLPRARDLAEVIGVNANTVLRALRTLRDEGLPPARAGWILVRQWGS